MKVGIVFFSLAKRIQGRTKAKSVPEKYLLVSTSETLAKIITSFVQKKVDFLDWKTEKEVNLSSISTGNGTQVILDNEFISFKECIHIQEKFRNKGFTFRILPKNANFIIGSDSSNDRGEIVKLPKDTFN